ncbi:MAG: 2-hydroxyacid dehydrogenase [Candidatus Nanohalobium sp.]
MKVAWFDSESWHQDVDSDHRIDFFNSPADISVLDSSYDAISICSESEVSRELMEQVEPRKILCRTSGYENVDIEAANEMGTRVQNAPGYGKESVAEYNMALILDAAKKITWDSGLEPDEDSGSRGLELKGRTLGVVGAGRIGRELLKRAAAFGMDLIAFDPYRDEEAAEEIGYEYVELEELLEASDIVSINCPLTESTRKLISGKEFDLMDGVVFVNVARGGVVDTSALRDALESGSVSTAALDVVEEGKFDLLNDRKDVVFTPHNAYNTEEAVRRRVEMTLDNLESEENTVNDVKD